jgi:hypothetical protein
MLQAIAPILGEQIGRLMQRRNPQPFHKNRIQQYLDDEPPAE